MIRGEIRNVEERPVLQTPPIRASIHNRFDIEVIDANTGKVRQRAHGLNTICDQLWTRMLAPNKYFNYIHYGTGSGTPSSGDKSLFNYYGGASVGDSTSITNDFQTGVAYAKRSIQLTASTAVGVTITEVGIAYDSASGSLCTHAMLKDMNGNAVSITKTDTDVVNIYATVYVHYGAAGFDKGSIRLYHNPSNRHTLLQFLCGVTSAFMSTAYISKKVRLAGEYYCQEGADYRQSVTHTYDPANKKIRGAVSRLESSGFNIGGIRQIMVGDYYTTWTGSVYRDGLSMSFRVGGDWFPNTEISNEAVGTGDGSTVDFALDFPFAHDARVYVDGVETTDFVLDYGPHDNDACGYFDWIQEYSRPGNHVPFACNPSSNFTGSRYFYNPAWALGLKTLSIGKNVSLFASDDMTNWVTVRDATGSDASPVTIPDEYRHYKYWKAAASDSSRFAYYDGGNTFDTDFTDKKLHFNTPPASGAVITADYKTDTIAKDANHVFDMSFEIQLGEYVDS